MDVDIVRIGADQVALLEHADDDVFDDAIDPGRLAAYLAETNHLMVVAVAGGEVIGQARGMVHRHPDQPTELYIDNLGTTPARLRQGVATRMLDELFAWGRELGCEEAWVGTEVDNVAACALYEARGARPETFVLYFYAFDAR